MDACSAFSPWSPPLGLGLDSNSSHTNHSPGYFDNLPNDYQFGLSLSSRPSLNRSKFSSSFGEGAQAQTPQDHQNGWTDARKLKDECLTKWELARVRLSQILNKPESEIRSETKTSHNRYHLLPDQTDTVQPNNTFYDHSQEADLFDNQSSVNDTNPRPQSRPFLSPLQTSRLGSKYSSSGSPNHSTSYLNKRAMTSSVIKASPLRHQSPLCA